MPIYEAELSDGRIVEFESEREPTHDELLAAISQPAPAPAAPPDNRDAERAQIALERDQLRKERVVGDAMERAFGAAQQVLEPLSPSGLMNQPARLASKVSGENYSDPFQPGKAAIAEIPEPKGDSVAAGVGKFAARFGNMLQSPESLVTLPVAPASAGVRALFAGDIAMHLPESVAESAQVLGDTESTPADKTVATLTPVSSALMAGLLLKSGGKSVETPQTPGAIIEQSVAKEPLPSPVETVAKEPVKAEPLAAEPNLTPETASKSEVSAPVEPSEAKTGVNTPPEAPAPQNTPKQANPSIGAGIQAALEKNKWTSATSEAGFIDIGPLKDFYDAAAPHVKSVVDSIVALGKEAVTTPKMNDYRRSVLAWSGKLQKSFGEAATARKDIEQRVPDRVRREGITNWIQANGDATVLANRAAATTNPKLKAGYEAALNLTPEEIAVATDVKAAYDALGMRGQTYEVVNNFRDNYVTQIWNLGKGAAMGGTRTLRDKFQFNKARTFETFFDGEQVGMVPKTKDIAKLLPVYLHEMNNVIAARQLVQQMSQGVASDGRPLLAPRGTGTTVTDPGTGTATLVMPKSVKGDTFDYKSLPNQPALNGWRWASQDSAGNPVFIKSDLAVHPEAFAKLKNVLGRSALREWYDTRTSTMAQVPKVLVKVLDMVNSETKRTMLGLLAPFHQVQEGTHAIGHRVNPFSNIPKIDLVGSAAQADAARHGLMLLPDRASANQFMEGFRPSGLVSKIPGIGKLADHYSEYLFHQYIPGLKFKTYQAILERNNKLYDADLAAGRVRPEDLKILSAEQANAAYGHLNYADFGRNPTIQHIAQLGLLAPDFLEARARFAGQAIRGVGGAKVGREQLLALATLAISQAATAYTAAKLSGGEWDHKHPFEFRKNNRVYTFRSVPEDISSLMNNSRMFVHSRLSPIVGKGALQYTSGVDWRGQRVTAGETTKELLKQPVPLTLRGFLGTSDSSLTAWEQLAGSVGLKISRYSSASELYEMVQKFRKNSGNPKLVQEYEDAEKSVNPESHYRDIRLALERNDLKEAKEAFEELRKTKSRSDIMEAMNPKNSDLKWKPLAGMSRETERAFIKTLSDKEKAVFHNARKERMETYKRLQKALAQK